MKKFSAAGNIEASPQKIWDLLVDGDHYPNWDPGMIQVEGAFALGEKVKFFTTFNPERAFNVKITGFEPGKKMILTSGMPLGLFKSERTHTLTPTDNGGTNFHTEEIFTGLLLPVFAGKLPDLTSSFEAFVSGLKEEAEGG